MKTFFRIVVSICLPAMVMTTDLAANEGKDSHAEFRALDQQVQDIKQQVLDLNRDLFILEEELLYPSSTQISIFVSADVGKLFSLDSVQIKLDDKVLSNYLYTDREVNALNRGGVHRSYTGNLKAGDHELVALVVGRGPHGRDYKRGAELRFSKTLGPKYVELRIRDDSKGQRPKYELVEW